MRHLVRKSKLNRGAHHRPHMLNNLVASLILYEKIETTAARAKAVRSTVDKVISIAKKREPVVALRMLNGLLHHPRACQKLVREFKERYHARSSGFTRSTKMGFRAGDAAPMIRLELI